MLTEVAWAAHVGCDDVPTGRIGLYTILKLISRMPLHDTHGYTISDPETDGVLRCLREADPQMKHWYLHTNRHGLHSVWRRKEWNESMTKQQQDAARKEVLIASEQEYQAAKEEVMEFMIVIADGNKRLAEKLFEPMANNREALLKKGRAIAAMKKEKGMI